jgi:hypothetical protein
MTMKRIVNPLVSIRGKEKPIKRRVVILIQMDYEELREKTLVLTKTPLAGYTLSNLFHLFEYLSDGMLND